MKSPVSLLLGGTLLLILGGASVVSSSGIGKTYQVYHKLGNESKMTSRGKITIAPPSDEDSIGLVATFHPDSSAQLDMALFDAMVENGALYTVIVSEEGVDTTTTSVVASVPGCSIRRSNLREEIGLSISPTGKLLGVSYRPIISPLAPKTCQQIKPLSEKPEAIYGRGGTETVSSMPFKTTVYFESHKPMMEIPAVLSQTYRPPPGLKWYRRNAQNNPSAPGGVKREGGGFAIPGVDDKPAGSFLYKYWYFFVPIAIVLLTGGGPEEQMQGGGGDVAAVAVGGGAAAGNSVKQRRGKRD
jgi:hypothetical protein